MRKWNHRNNHRYNSQEFGRSCEELSWNHRTSTHHRSETHVISERAVRRIKEGTSAVLLQSGSDEKWRADSLACCYYLRNVQDLLADGKTLYEKRFGEPLKGPVIRFGCNGSLPDRGPVKAPPIWQERFSWNALRTCTDRGEEGEIWKGDICGRRR